MEVREDIAHVNKEQLPAYIEHLLCTGHHSEHFTRINSFILTQPSEVRTIIPISQMREMEA